MTKILFVDDRLHEVLHQWERSGCASNHELLPLEPFDSVERTRELVAMFKPDVILIGYGLGKPDVTGADVIRALREAGYDGRIVANSGGGMEQFNRSGVTVDGSVNRNPGDLKKTLEKQGENDGPQ